MVENDREAMRRHLRFMNARSNPVQTLISLLVVAALFIFFQATIMKNLARTQMMLLNSGSEQHNKGKYVHHIKHVAAPDIAQRINPKFASKMAKEIGLKVNGTLLRGVKKDHRKFYLPNHEGMFTCLSGNETIDFHLVNNDYCDCSDGSDEPGTSACKNGKFYCEPELRYMMSSRVNDGICDCCDGSDEWKGVTLPPDLKLPDDVQRAPCSDTCLDYHHQKIHDENMMKEGFAAKQEIIKNYKNQDVDEEGKYGEENEFHYLSKECYVYKSPSYMYEICPYHNASQIGEETWLIGSGGELKGNFELIMDHGANEHCPEGRPRKSILMFQCSPETLVKYVSEKSTCEYHVKFHTPAACVSPATAAAVVPSNPQTDPSPDDKR